MPGKTKEAEEYSDVNTTAVSANEEDQWHMIRRRHKRHNRHAEVDCDIDTEEVIHTSGKHRCRRLPMELQSDSDDDNVPRKTHKGHPVPQPPMIDDDGLFDDDIAPFADNDSFSNSSISKLHLLMWEDRW